MTTFWWQKRKHNLVWPRASSFKNGDPQEATHEAFNPEIEGQGTIEEINEQLAGKPLASISLEERFNETIEKLRRQKVIVIGTRKITTNDLLQIIGNATTERNTPSTHAITTNPQGMPMGIHMKRIHISTQDVERWIESPTNDMIDALATSFQELKNKNPMEFQAEMIQEPVEQQTLNVSITINDQQYTLFPESIEYVGNQIRLRNIWFKTLEDVEIFFNTINTNREVILRIGDHTYNVIYQLARNTEQIQTIWKTAQIVFRIVEPQREALQPTDEQILEGNEEWFGVRQSGRTTRAIKECIANKGIYVVHNDGFARQLKGQYPELDVRVFNSHSLYGNHQQVFYDHYLHEKGLTTKGIKPKVFQLTDLLTLKLEPQHEIWDGERIGNLKTNIYVAGKLFKQCKYLLLNLEAGKSYKEIESIDEAGELLGVSIDEVKGEYDGRMERDHTILTPEEEFIGHCSNLQAWVENDYDLRIIHTNLGLPLAAELVKHGEHKARMAIVEEVTHRIINNPFKAYKTLKKYLAHFAKEELEIIKETLKEDKAFVDKVIEDFLRTKKLSYLYPKEDMTDD